MGVSTYNQPVIRPGDLRMSGYNDPVFLTLRRVDLPTSDEIEFVRRKMVFSALWLNASAEEQELILYLLVGATDKEKNSLVNFAVCSSPKI
jgi:hypothetical protein